ncbi:MAG: primosomal replication protein N, partial [Thiobacillus sp.]|nr:primosomal replication protein N [Thiobacillus sp.]
LRYSPAGVPIVEAVVHHRSSQTVASQTRQVECELTVQASGSLASQLTQITVGTQVKMEGALNRRSVNSRQLLLILNRIEKE